MTLKQVIEALVFASQKPLTPKEIVSALKTAAVDADEAREFVKTKEAQVAALLEELKVECLQEGHAFQLVEKASGWQFVTNPEYALWVRQLYPESKPARLSGPALETLAIVAYRQPIVRADIEAIRGVAVDGVVQSLLERGLIRIAGRSEVPGRPLLYETTQFFLEHFGLKQLDELPNSNELRRVNLPSAVIPTPAAASEQQTEQQMTLGEVSSAPAPASEASTTGDDVSSTDAPPSTSAPAEEPQEKPHP